VKKTFAILAAVLFVLSFAASAFAIHAEIPAETQAIVAKGATQITLGGEIRFRGWFYDNLGADGASAVGGIPQDSNSKSNYDGRVRLSLDAKVSPNVQGFVMLETGDINNSTTDVYTWGGAFPYPKGGNKTSNLSILQSWILYTGSGLFGIPAGLKVGHMPLRLSEGQFFDHTQFGDDAIVFFMDPTKALHVGLLTVKFAEGLTGDQTDDLDGYVGLFTYKLNDKHTIGANWTYLNNSDGGMQFHNVGLHANGSIGNFGYKAEGDIQFGQAAELPTGDEIDAEGWAAFLALNYKLNPVNLRASAAIGSGQDSSDDLTGFQTFVGTIQHYTFVYDYRAATTAGFVGSGIANTTYFNLGVDWQATKDMMLSLDGYYIRATDTDFFEDTLGHNVDKDAGWEIDASFKYNIARNLTYSINAGYFKTGDFYEDIIAGSDSEGATVVNNVLTLSF
jgi:hypothetical protein